MKRIKASDQTYNVPFHWLGHFAYLQSSSEQGLSNESLYNRIIPTLFIYLFIYFLFILICALLHWWCICSFIDMSLVSVCPSISVWSHEWLCIVETYPCIWRLLIFIGLTIVIFRSCNMTTIWPTELCSDQCQIKQRSQWIFFDYSFIDIK